MLRRGSGCGGFPKRPGWKPEWFFTFYLNTRGIWGRGCAECKSQNSGHDYTTEAPPFFQPGLPERWGFNHAFLMCYLECEHPFSSPMFLLSRWILGLEKTEGWNHVILHSVYSWDEMKHERVKETGSSFFNISLSLFKFWLPFSSLQWSIGGAMDNLFHDILAASHYSTQIKIFW